MTKATVIRAGLIAVAVGLTAGCATTGDLDKLRNELNEVRAATDKAQQDASAAGAAALDAQTSADAAADNANSALRIAEESQSCCQRNTRRMDRMFKDSVLK